MVVGSLQLSYASPRWWRAYTVWLIALLTLCSNAALALPNEAQLQLTVNTRPGQVELILRSTGRVAARNIQVNAEIAGESYTVGSLASLGPKKSKTFRFQPKKLSQLGTHVVLSRVGFTSGKEALSLVNAAYLHASDKPRVSQAKLDLHVWPLRQQGYAVAHHDKKHRFRLLLPNGVRILSQSGTATGTRFRLGNDDPLRGRDQSVFGILEVPSPDGLQARIVQRRLRSRAVVKERSVFSRWFMAVLGLVSLVISYSLYSRGPPKKSSSDRVALVRYTFTIAVVSLWFVVMRSSFMVSDWFFATVQRQDLMPGKFGSYLYRVGRTLANWLYFEGRDFDYFFSYVQDTLYAWVLTGNFFWIRYVLKPKPSKDKYWHLLHSLFSLPNAVLRKAEWFWSEQAKIGLLALLVKGFYIPLVCGWTINNVYHQIFLSRNFVFRFEKVQAYVVATLIFIDVAIFCFGYLVEMPRLKNEIRSVEPTLLGWVACLMCYPPFNGFAFEIFNQSLFGPHQASTGFARRLCLALVAILWLVYTWASIALGPKASNLTNRGIVMTGPYAVVRHPAYISKVGLWAISAYFLADKLFLMVCGLAFVYAVRAFTEERHLSKDPEYLVYKEKVRYRFIPGII